MKKRSIITKVLSLALTTVIVVSAMSFDCKAASRADDHKRALTAEEITAIEKVFDWQYYQKANPDLEKEFGKDNVVALTDHFLNYGIWEERQAAASFNVDAYASRNLDLRAMFGDDIIAYYVHYANSSNTERYYRPIPTLEQSYYRNTDVYSVYDFEVGSTKPKTGALPMQTVNYHPRLHFAWEDEND